jgi:hypothetical protein
VFDGGLKLGAKGWILNNWTYGVDGQVGPLTASSTPSSNAQSPFFTCTPSSSYTFSCWIGGTWGVGNFNIYINWYDSANTFVGQSTALSPTGGLGNHRDSLTVTSPASATKGRLVANLGAGAVTVAAAWQFKVEGGSAVTPFNDATTSGALYANGIDIDTLKPAEIGSNVTETRISSAIVGQGGLATKNTVSTGDINTGAVILNRYYGGYAPGGSDTSALTVSAHNLVSADTDLVTITQSFSGAELLICPLVGMTWVSGATAIIMWGIKYDGVVIKKWYVTGGVSSQQLMELYTPFWRHTPSAGTHTYKLCLLSQGVSQTVNVGERILDLREQKGGIGADTSGGSL